MRSFAALLVWIGVLGIAGSRAAHADPTQEGRAIPVGDDLNALLSQRAMSQLAAVYRGSGRTLELTQPVFGHAYPVSTESVFTFG